jgi:hypothetical protein
MSERYKKFQTDYAEVDTAMVGYFVMMLHRTGKRSKRGHPFRDQELQIDNWIADNGECATREAVLSMAPVIEAAWQALAETERDNVVWDWEFVPTFILCCISWLNELPTPVYQRPEQMAEHWRKSFAAISAFHKSSQKGK